MLNLIILLTFKLVDGIILFVLLMILGYLFYVSFIKHRKEPCHGCAHAKSCQKLNKSDFVEKYHKCKEQESVTKCSKCK